MKFIKLGAILIVSFLAFNTSIANEPSPLDTCNLKEQFSYLEKKSTRYNDFRVVKIATLNILKKHIFDTINAIQATNLSNEAQLRTEGLINDSLNAKLLTTEDYLAQAQKAINGIDILGFTTSKKTYNTIMWSVSLTFIGLFLFLLLLYKRSNSVTISTKKDLEELKTELEHNRRRSREREEKVVRRLHDEINRYKKRVYQLEKSTQS